MFNALQSVHPELQETLRLNGYDLHQIYIKSGLKLIHFDYFHGIGCFGLPGRGGPSGRSI